MTRQEARGLACRLINAGVDYDTAEGVFLDATTGRTEEETDALMRELDEVYGR